MSKTLSDLTTIVRKVTGRIDQSISDGTIFDYISDFYSLEFGQETRLFDQQGFYEFTTTASTDEYSIDMDAADPPGEGEEREIKYSIFKEPVWVDGYRVNFYTDPTIFFAKWPETQTYTEQRPTDVLWYNNILTFRASPDDAYSVKITAYELNNKLTQSSDVISEDYWFRYIAYGAALDLLADSGEFEKYAQVMPVFERYKSMVNARTYTQHQQKVVIRNF
jgi:hypothetical protein